MPVDNANNLSNNPSNKGIWNGQSFVGIPKVEATSQTKCPEQAEAFSSSFRTLTMFKIHIQHLNSIKITENPQKHELHISKPHYVTDKTPQLSLGFLSFLLCLFSMINPMIIHAKQ